MIFLDKQLMLSHYFEININVSQEILRLAQFQGCSKNPILPCVLVFELKSMNTHEGKWSILMTNRVPRKLDNVVSSKKRGCYISSNAQQHCSIHCIYIKDTENHHCYVIVNELLLNEFVNYKYNFISYEVPYALFR